MKHFKSIFPRELLKRAKMAWRNNPLVVVPVNEEDKLKAFLMNKIVKDWWKNGGHKKVYKKVIKDL